MTHVKDREVAAAAARRLLPVSVLARALKWARGDVEVAAEELQVDAATLQVRLETLSADEHAEVAAVRRRRHLRVIQRLPSKPSPKPLQVPPKSSTIGYSAERGRHMTQAPPGWFLDLLAEMD